MTKNRDYAAYLYILPAFLVIAIFQFFPIFFSLYMSFFDWNLITPRVFIGIGNYVAMVKEPLFWRSVFNTVYFSAGSVILGLAASLWIAVFFNRKIRGIGFYRSIYFIPFITSLIAASIVWQWIFDSKAYGLLNWFVTTISPTTAPQKWLENEALAMPSIIVMSIWRTLGYNALIFLTRLQNIDQSYYEAAEVDGATEWQKFRRITWPLLTPTTLFLLIVSTISSFQVFGQIYIMTPFGGPRQSTNVLVYYLYQNAFENFDMGYACSIAYFIFGVLLLLTLIQRKVLGAKASEMSG